MENINIQELYQCIQELDQEIDDIGGKGVKGEKSDKFVLSLLWDEKNYVSSLIRELTRKNKH